MKSLILILALSSFAAGRALAGLFTVGPDYRPPTNSVPQAYKAAEFGNWKEGRPLDNVPKGSWWEIFQDVDLNRLENLAAEASPNLKAAVARVEQARAVARVARADLLPRADLRPSLERQRFSPNQVPSFGGITANTFSVPLDLSYELDLWGRVRRSFESAHAEAQSSLADYYSVLLTVQADVAQNYFSLRSLDAEIASVTATVGLRQEQVRLVRSRFDGGIGSDLDVARAETELASTESDAAGLAQRRAQLENALAVLVGSHPSTFSMGALTNLNWNPPPPEVPAGLPAELLERRPDIAAAERQLAAANARIGIAKAAFFPVVSLTASGGYLSGQAESLFNWDSRVWSLGPSISLPIFAGGRNRANYRRARAGFEESVARYRLQVLTAFQELETSLAGVRYLTQQMDAQQRALAHARRAADLAEQRYRSGIVGYLEVVDANREALLAERASAQLAGQRLNNAVQLIKALGGGWESSPARVTTKARGSLDKFALQTEKP